MKRMWVLILCVLLFSSTNIIQVSAAPQDLPLGTTDVLIQGAGGLIFMDTFDSFFWDDEEATGGYKLVADCIVTDVMMNPAPTILKIDFTLTATPYPQGRNGPNGNPDDDSWTTGWVTFDGPNPPGQLPDDYQGNVDLTLYWQDPPEETEVTVDIVLWWWNQGNPQIVGQDDMSFWITYTEFIDLGESNATVEVDDESASGPDNDDMEMESGGCWELVAYIDVDDECLPLNTRYIHLEFSILVIDYPQGRSGQEGDDIGQEIWYLPDETGYEEFDGNKDVDDLDLRFILECPESPQEFKVAISLIFWEKDIREPYDYEDIFWISEAD